METYPATFRLTKRNRDQLAAASYRTSTTKNKLVNQALEHWLFNERHPGCPVRHQLAHLGQSVPGPGEAVAE